jgi:hypothetical protein
MSTLFYSVHVKKYLRPALWVGLSALLSLLTACGGGGGGGSSSTSVTTAPIVRLTAQDPNATVYPNASNPVVLLPYFSYGTGVISWEDSGSRKTLNVTSGSSYSFTPSKTTPYQLVVTYPDPNNIRLSRTSDPVEYTVNVTNLDAASPTLSFKIDDAATSTATGSTVTFSANSSHKIQAQVDIDTSKLSLISTTMTFNGTVYNDIISNATLTSALPNADVMLIVKYKDIRVTDSTPATLSALLHLQTRTDTLTQTSSMSTGRSGHIAIWLPTINKLLVAGGISDTTQTRLKTAELYDPMNNTWTRTGDMSTARLGHAATLLGQSGKVLVTGGTGTTSGSAEIYDTTSGKWTSTGAMAAGRQYHTATELKDGNVLIAGGTVSDASKASIVEIYKTASGTFVSLDATKAMPSLFRSRHTATLMSDGATVVLAGGAEMGARQSFDVFKYKATAAGEPTDSTWGTSGTLKYPRYDHTATVFTDSSVEKIAFIGGYTNKIEICNPVATSSPCADAGTLKESRGLHTSTYMPNTSTIVVIGGSTGAALLSSTEIYTPAGASNTTTTTSGKALNVARAGHTASLLVDNTSILITGSNLPPSGSTNYTATTELYRE